MLIHLSVDGHFDCFQVSAISNKATVNIHMQVFIWQSFFFFFLGKCLEMEWLAHTNCQSFPKWLYRVILLSAVYRSPTSSISSLKLGLVIFKNILGLVVCMYWGLTVVIICILLMILSIFARTYVPIMYLFAHFKSELFILLLMTF